MLRFYADRFLSLTKILSQLEGIGKASKSSGFTNDVIGEDSTDKNDLITFCEQSKVKCEEMELTSGADQIARIVEKVNTGRTTWGDFLSLTSELNNRIHDELKRRLLFCISPKDAELYSNKKPFGDKVNDSFHHARTDIEESAKCFALGRWTACVFHLNRVVELGLKVLAVEMGLPFDRNSWEAHLKDIERELEKRQKAGGPRSPDEIFYSTTATHISRMKVAWRNPTSHVGTFYDEEISKDIFDAVRCFMKHISERLSDETIPL
jgi:hypothetical protein